MTVEVRVVLPAERTTTLVMLLPKVKTLLNGDVAMNDGRLRFEILGRVRAYRGDEELDLGHVRQQAVLALLLLHAGEPVPLAQIVHTLWNGDPPSNGDEMVLRYIGALRRILDPRRTALLAFTDGGYVLRAGDNAVDTGVFRAALDRARTEHRTGTIGDGTQEVRQALTRWQEEPLSGLTGPYFDAARARLNDERATASQLLAKPILAEPPAATSASAAATPADGPAEPVDPWAGHDLFPPDWSTRP